MQYRTLGRTGLRCRRWIRRLGDRRPVEVGRPRDRLGGGGRCDVPARYRRAYDAGVTLFDTSDAYGRGEARLCWARRSRRSGTVVIATKVATAPWTAGGEGVLQGLDPGSARREPGAAGDDYVDLYQLHSPTDTADYRTKRSKRWKHSRSRGRSAATGVGGPAAHGRG